MKKAFTLVVLIVTARMAFAQGQVQFNNSQATGPVMQWTSAWNSNLVPVPKTAGGVVNGRVEILTYYNSTTASLTPLFTSAGGRVQTPYTTLGAYLAANPGWVDSATAPIGSLQNGVFNAGVLTLGSSSGVAGAPVSYAIVGWTGSYATWDLQGQFMILTNPLQTQGLALSLDATPPAFQAWVARTPKPAGAVYTRYLPGISPVLLPC